jgi:hypothetical protein
MKQYHVITGTNDGRAIEPYVAHTNELGRIHEVTLYADASRHHSRAMSNKKALQEAEDFRKELIESDELGLE